MSTSTRASHMRWLFLGIVLVTFVHMGLFVVMQKIMPAPYMDEVFHIPQAFDFLDFRLDKKYDPAITTPPGVYVFAAVLQGPSSFLVDFLKASKLLRDKEAVAQLSIIRGTQSVFLGIACFLICFVVVQRINCFLWTNLVQILSKYRMGVINEEVVTYRVKNNYDAVCAQSLFLRALRLHGFVFSFFYFFIFYTESGSTFCLLAMVAAHLMGSHRMAGGYGIASLFMRQLNIVWVFVCAVSVLAWKVPLQIGPSAKMASTFKNFLKVSFTNLPFHIIAGGGFLGFLVWNEGNIALGHQEYHGVSIHLAMITYWGFLNLILGLFNTLIPFKWLNFTGKRSDGFSSSIRFRDLVTAKRCLLYTIVLAFFAVFAGLYHVEHPFLLADNRHLSFYFWRKFGKHKAVRFALIPAAALVSWIAYFIKPVEITKRLSVSFCDLFWHNTPVIQEHDLKSEESGECGGTKEADTKEKPDGKKDSETKECAGNTAEGKTMSLDAYLHSVALSSPSSPGESVKNPSKTKARSNLWIQANLPFQLSGVVFLICSCAVLSMTPLLEFRYFVVPMMVMLAVRPLDSVAEELFGLAITLALNILVFYIFINKTFVNEEQWGVGLQRVML